MLSEKLDVITPPLCQLLKLPATHLGMHKSSTTEPGGDSALPLQEEPSLSAPGHLAFSLNCRLCHADGSCQQLRNDILVVGRPVMRNFHNKITSTVSATSESLECGD